MSVECDFDFEKFRRHGHQGVSDRNTLAAYSEPEHEQGETRTTSEPGSKYCARASLPITRTVRASRASGIRHPPLPSDHAMADQNPFPALQAGLRGALTVHLLPGESTQLKVMSGLLGALLLCQIISVIVRWRSDSLWLFRTSSRGFISPAGTNNFLISCLVFGLLVQPVHVPYPADVHADPVD